MTGQEGGPVGAWGVTWVSTQQEAVSLRPPNPIRTGRALGCNNQEMVVREPPWNCVIRTAREDVAQQGVQMRQSGQPRYDMNMPGDGPQTRHCSQFLLLRNKSTKFALTGNSAERRKVVSTRRPVISYLRMATVSASGGEAGTGQITSGLSPLAWKTLRNRITGGYGPCMRQSGHES